MKDEFRSSAPFRRTDSAAGESLVSQCSNWAAIALELPLVDSAGNTIGSKRINFAKIAERLEIVRSYYTRIDRTDLAWVLGIFAENARYVRCEQLFEGLEQIQHFFVELRNSRLSHSEVTLFPCLDGSIFARGHYLKSASDGMCVEGDFCDHWEFDSNDKVCFRETSLFSSYELIS